MPDAFSCGKPLLKHAVILQRSTLGRNSFMTPSYGLKQDQLCMISLCPLARELLALATVILAPSADATFTYIQLTLVN